MVSFGCAFTSQLRIYVYIYVYSIYIYISKQELRVREFIDGNTEGTCRNAKRHLYVLRGGHGDQRGPTQILMTYTGC